MIISHEVPLSILNESREFNDYDYCLVHHYVKYPKYRDFFLKSREMGRFIILDNSVVELKESFDLEIYLEVEKELKPNIVIAPDNFLEPEKNIDLLSNFLRRYSGDATVMGVPHGNSLKDYTKDFAAMSHLTDCIGISIHPFMERFKVIKELLFLKLINDNTHYHLLGCRLPQEFKEYNFDKEHSFIKSLDTSNPVIHGLLGYHYSTEGLDFKSKFNIDDIFENRVSEDEMKDILFNINKFKEFTRWLSR